MKRFLVLALVCFAASGAFAACDENGGGLAGIYVGDLEAGFSTGELASAVESECSVEACDGGLDGLSYKGDNFDLDGIWELIFYPANSENALHPVDIMNTTEFGDAIDLVFGNVEVASRGEDTRRLTFSATADADCANEGGLIAQSLSFTATFFGNGSIDTSEDVSSVLITTFINCLIQGDLLDNGGTSSALLNGSYTVREVDSADTDETDDTGRVTGRVTLITDDNGDAEGGDSFWARVANINAFDGWDGSDAFENGGVCFGEAIDFGEDPDDDADDDCADGVDEVSDGFVGAGAGLVDALEFDLLGI